jgi:hypothetical protein
MNEKELKRVFLSSLDSGHIRNNSVIPQPDRAELRVVQEGHFRSFDLVIAAITTPEHGRTSNSHENLLTRTKLVTHFSEAEACRPDCIQFFPVELKSDEDSIDGRLPNQIIDAIITFGQSIVVLDRNHSKLIKKSRLDRVLPASIICYTGDGDYFEQVSVFDRFVACGIFNFERFNLARQLHRLSSSTSAKAYRRLESLQQILQKIVFSQLHFENAGLTEEEQQFICALAEIKVPNRRKAISSILRQGANRKLTDYI